MVLDQQYRQRAAKYHRRQIRLTLGEEFATLVLLAIWVFLGPILVKSVGPVGRYGLLILLAVTVYVSYQVFLFVFDYLQGYRLEHQFDLSTESFGKWLWRHTKGITLAGLLIGVLLVGLYSALWYLPYWYFWTWLGWMLLSVVLAQVFPTVILPIFYTSKPLEDPDLCARLERLAQGSGVRIEGVYTLELSASTTRANAMLAGLGKTRRVLLGDTLLSKLTPEQIEVVFAHELGHHVNGHLYKMLMLHGLASVAMIALVWAIIGDYAGSSAEFYGDSVGALPLVLFVLGLFSFVWRPLLFAVGRRFERQSDLHALKTTGNRADYIAAFETLALSNLADPDPPRWVEIMFYEHPPIMRRIAMAEQWDS